MSAVKKAVSGATSFLVGGKQSVLDAKNFSDMPPEERKRLEDIEAKINAEFAKEDAYDPAQAKEIEKLFVDSLKTFMARDQNAKPGDIEKATALIDKTFTDPAQAQLKQQTADLQSQYAAQAAAMGRNPNADIATQQAFLGDATRAGLSLNAERGARIQADIQTQTDNNENSFQNSFNRGLSQLSAGMQGSGFLNQLGQQAFQNKLSLLNGRTGLAGLYQNERGQKAAGIQTSSGLLTNINAMQNSLGNVTAGGSDNKKSGERMLAMMAGGGGGG